MAEKFYGQRAARAKTHSSSELKVLLQRKARADRYEEITPSIGAEGRGVR
jgi:hypothetical protein